MICALTLLLAPVAADTIAIGTSGSITTDNHLIDEVEVVSAPRSTSKRSAKGQVASVDEHLAQLDKVNLVRRGTYALEPVVNNMQSERLSTTIDGMKIFYACTDKMDPVTSYVESGNLQSISLNSGLSGNPQSTGNIGGSLDLKLRKVGFNATPLALNLSAGHEFNGHLQVYGADAAISRSAFYTNFGAFFRHAQNYKAGGNNEVPFSQFQKVNAFANLGFQPAGGHVLEATFIFDRATNVGYPALNMDVLKAEGLIGSLSYKRNLNLAWAKAADWETKVYYNHITHVMDDTHRPDVEIHMDMPGESQTAGLYSLLHAKSGRHDILVNYDLYYNRLFADMTMYPGGAAPMYMVTWPDVGTLNTGLALNDVVRLPHNQSLSLSAKVAWQTQKLNSDEGYEALHVFFPRMIRNYHQTTGRIAVGYAWAPSHWNISVGAGWGSRAPSVTEAYGYYLNNTFDQFDYIGNPHLKNEAAFELNGSLAFAPATRFNVSLGVDAFLFQNYIIGALDSRLSPMTVGAEGVKVYQNDEDVHIVNTTLTANWQVAQWLRWKVKLAYAIGRDGSYDLLLISPFAYQTQFNGQWSRFGAQAELQGNAKQVNYGQHYGEQPTPAYAIVNLNAHYAFGIKKVYVTIRGGVENLLDRAYSSYSDWNKIPQKGRNFYLNIALSI